MKILVFAAAAVAAWGVQAAVWMPHVFGDNMVLQRGQRVPVWGKAAPGEKVTVYDSGMNPRQLRVAGVFENYYGQLFFLTPHGYEEIFGSEPEQNCFYVKTGDLPLSELQKKLEAELRSVIGLGFKVRLVEPKGIERSTGKAKRVIDNRKFK